MGHPSQVLLPSRRQEGTATRLLRAGDGQPPGIGAVHLLFPHTAHRTDRRAEISSWEHTKAPDGEIRRVDRRVYGLHECPVRIDWWGETELRDKLLAADPHGGARVTG